MILSTVLSLAILILAGVLGARGAISTNGVVGLAAVAIGGFLLFVLRNRIQRLRVGKVVVELKGQKSPL